MIPVVARQTRKFVRSCIWVVLTCCVLLDGALGEGAISGCCDVGYIDANGHFALPGPEPGLWPWIIGFILLQGALITALLRLRDKEPLQRLTGIQ